MRIKICHISFTFSLEISFEVWDIFIRRVDCTRTETGNTPVRWTPDPEMAPRKEKFLSVAVTVDCPLCPTNCIRNVRSVHGFILKIEHGVTVVHFPVQRMGDV